MGIMKLVLLLPVALAASAGKYDGVPTEVNESILVDFSWCRTYNSSGTCGVAQLNHAQCCKRTSTPCKKIYINIYI